MSGKAWMTARPIEDQIIHGLLDCPDGVMVSTHGCKHSGQRLEPLPEYDLAVGSNLLTPAQLRPIIAAWVRSVRPTVDLSPNLVYYAKRDRETNQLGLRIAELSGEPVEKQAAVLP